MIIGSGIDIVETARIEKAMQRWGDGFLTRVFTGEEIAYSRSKKFSPQHFAARFAAKEAVVKALGNGGLKSAKWKDIEILNDPTGKPVVKLYGQYRYLRKERKISEIFLSISHAKDYALASVVLDSNEK